MIGGSNICDSTIVHFFAGLPGDQFDTPVDIQFKLGDPNPTQYPGQVEGHPYIVDWDRVEPVEFDFPRQYDQAAIVNRSPSDLTRIEFYFSFGDFDGDGAADIVYSARVRIGIEQPVS